MTSSKNQAPSPFATNGTARASAPASVAPQDMQTTNHPSLHSLIRGSGVHQHHRPSGVTFPLRESFEMLGVQTDRPLLDILDEALAIQAPPTRRTAPFQPTRPCTQEARQ
ncbi:expressed unknown protein [Seminavis robusta]|uniref:Uncharacterized protein n=1 Tax=Seminavis robusta TaxID=568900 RepID=A0A9N8DD27_9STRA|nr:expressed unknown protein [Seminavis robusta]|eukprot:Sro39_g024250.1 n/a (110) ;mRNA; f:118538-118867